MAKNITFDAHMFDGAKQGALGTKDKVVGFFQDTILWYFTSITQFQQYAWMAVGAGGLFVIVALIMW